MKIDSSNQPVKVIVVDDQKEFRRAMVECLETLENVNIIGEAENGKEFLGLLKTCQPDVVFMDIEMPVLDGIETTKIVTSTNRFIKIIALSFHSDSPNIKKMLEAGARNYIIKDQFDIDIIEKMLAEY